MASWATGGKFPGAAFLCICVDPSAVATATEFSKLYFKSGNDVLVNGYIDNQSDFPSFQAQLGCQGFVIFNSANKIVVPKTLPWMQNRAGAFRDVEGKLNQLLQPPTPENPLDAPVGQHVKVVNLTSAAGIEVNGQLGEVTGSLENGRYQVKLSSCTKAFRPENLEDVAGAPLGNRVKIFGLTSEKGLQINGQVGVVRGSTQSGRYLVKLSASTASVRPENLEEVVEEIVEETGPLSGVPSVGHASMDAEHASCVEAINELEQKLTVPSLRRVRDEFAHHFEDEEILLQGSSFGKPSDCCDGIADGANKDSSFSAYASHVKDHERIVEIANRALAALSNACESSEGAVPKTLARELRKAFEEHANLYDALYVDKLAAPEPEMD